MIELNKSQQLALEDLIDWFVTDSNKQQVFKLFGYAGTGKTTLIKFLFEYLRSSGAKIESQIKIGTLSWKASKVLKKKGIKQAQSIHSLIYISYKDKKNRWRHTKRDLEYFKNIKMIVIDEASVVTKSMRKEIESLGCLVLYVGDPFQLPPIEKYGETDDFFDSWDVLLTEIVRQSANDQIIRLSMMLRNFEDFKVGTYDSVIIKNKYKHNTNDNLKYITNDSIILCGTNKTRKSLNESARVLKGHNPKNMPNNNEPLILFSGFNKKQIFNSDIIYGVNDLNEDPIRDDVEYFGFTKEEDDDECLLYNDDPSDEKSLIPMIYHDGENSKKQMLKIRGKGILWSFNYAISVHKAQGSEWDNILIYDESYCWKNEEKYRWQYTALTRAKKYATILI